MLPTPSMSEEEFLLLNETITQRVGLHFPEHKKQILESRLRPRLEALHLRNYFDYYLLLQVDRNGEMSHLTRQVSNNETYFFRETYQFDDLLDTGLALLQDSSPSDVLRVLSAGCSSGEEPYTLNIYAKESLVRRSGLRFEIDAFDIDRDRLAIARTAEYGPSSLRAQQEDRIGRHFREYPEGRFTLRTPYRGGVRFYLANIIDLETYRRPLAYDIVFCRNVLIYFSEPALRRAISNFAKVLRPGGLLFLGHSESIIGLSEDFETVRVGSCLAYRRVRP